MPCPAARWPTARAETAQVLARKPGPPSSPGPRDRHAGPVADIIPTLVFASSSPRPSASSGGYLADLALLVIGGSALLIAIVLWFDNAQGGLTGNGVFKSLELKPWATDPANAPLYPSNYLYYPLYGALCRLLDLLGVFAGDPRRQITILNAVSCSLCLAAVYLLGIPYVRTIVFTLGFV